MTRETAIVEFFRARLDETAATAQQTLASNAEARVRGMSSTLWGEQDAEATQVLREVEADRELLERYDYCVNMGGCPGNGDLDVARDEYERYVFPARMARFSDHPAHAVLVADRWVPEDYAAAVGAVTS